MDLIMKLIVLIEDAYFNEIFGVLGFSFGVFIFYFFVSNLLGMSNIFFKDGCLGLKFLGIF